MPVGTADNKIALGWALALALATLGLCGVSPASAETAVRIVHAPGRSLVPDVVLDRHGVLHMVYALGHNAYYVRSTDNGATFTRPVRVNSGGAVEDRMGERGPRLAVGSDGIIHVVWADYWKPGARCFARYSRSIDGGKTFQPSRQVSQMPGVDGVAVAADGKGTVLVFWRAMAAPKPDVPDATWIYMARSTDGGSRFGPGRRISVDGAGQLACACCMMRARVAPDGTVCLAFRGAERNIRDFWMLKGSPRGDRFASVRVNRDNWIINYCPMCGPELTFTPDGRALCAFMTGHRAYWAISDAGLDAFHLHVATPAKETNEIYPTAVADRRGEVLLLWQVGPLSTSATATVKWAIYGLDGVFRGRQGTVGTCSSGTKSTAFVGTDDNFYIVTSARPRQASQRG